MSFAVFKNGADVIVRQGMVVVRIVFVNGEFGTVVTVEPVFGCDPYHTVGIFVDVVDKTA